MLQPRSFVVVIQGGAPGTKITVEAEVGGGRRQVTLSEDHTILVTLEVAAADTLLFGCEAEGWAIEPDRKEVRLAHRGAPDVPHQISGLKLVPVTVPEQPSEEENLAPSGEKPELIEPEPAPSRTEEPGIPAEPVPIPGEPAAEPARVPTPKPDPCRTGSSLDCQLFLMTRADRAVEKGDCAAGASLVHRALKENSDLSRVEELVGPLASFFFHCGIGDTTPQPERYLQMTIQLFEQDPGAWCRPETAWLLGASYQALGKIAAAAAAADRAICPTDTVALEWEFYFRIQLGQRDLADQLARQARGDLHDFLEAWLRRIEGQCPSSIEKWPRIDPLPCRGLPPRICLRQQARLILACGGGEDITGAAYTLRQALPDDFEETNDSVPAELEALVADIAELDYAREAWDEAAGMFLRLARNGEVGEVVQGQRWCRYGSALLRAGREEDAQKAFTRVRELLPVGSLDWAVALNNELVLADRVGRPPTRAALATLEQALPLAGTSLNPEQRFWFEAIRFNHEILERIRTLRNPELGLARKVEAFRREKPAFLDVLRRTLDVARHRNSPTASAAPCAALALAGDIGGER